MPLQRKENSAYSECTQVTTVKIKKINKKTPKETSTSDQSELAVPYHPYRSIEPSLHPVT